MPEGCIDAHALCQIALQSVGVGAAKEVAEGIDAKCIDYLDRFLALFLFASILFGSTCAQRDAGAECKQDKLFHVVLLLNAEHFNLKDEAGEGRNLAAIAFAISLLLRNVNHPG